MTLDIKSAAYLADPYAAFKKMRSKNSVSRILPFNYWAVFRYNDVEMVLKNPALFSSAAISEEPDFNDPQFLLLSRGLLGTDGVDHIRLRQVLRKAFTPTTILELEPIIRETCTTLVTNIIKNEYIDFIQGLASPLPLLVITNLLGIETERHLDFKRWVDLLLTWRNVAGLEQAMKEASKMMAYFKKVIGERTLTPKQDLISKLIQASNNQQITYGEIISFIRLILVAGTDTTTSLLGNAALILSQNPGLLQTISDNPTLIPEFIEEVLRYDSPTISLTRRAVENTEIGGIKIKKNEIVLAMIASANHDEAIFAEPETFNINRNSKAHLGFGTGTHYCLGSQLARMQARIAFEELFKVSFSFKRFGSEPLQYLNSFFFRSLRSLNFQF